MWDRLEYPQIFDMESFCKSYNLANNLSAVLFSKGPGNHQNVHALSEREDRKRNDLPTAGVLHRPLLKFLIRKPHNLIEVGH